MLEEKHYLNCQEVMQRVRPRFNEMNQQLV